MKETKFIEENKSKWNRFEELYNSSSNDPEELSDLYMDITDDLSFAQTFYQKRTVRVYLNQLAQRVYTGVHKQKGESLRKFITVWQTSLPLEIYRSRKNLLFALVAFLVYVVIGAATTYVDPDFPRVVMGDAYVEMTLENISQGNPLGVYESDRQLDMFFAITSNNMKVAFLTFVVGFFFTVGTHMLLFYNGVMLGAFQYFFHAKGLLITSFLGIWIHGAFEISAIVLAGGAGITAGNGLLFPGSYTRLQSLQLSTKRGLKIMLSLVPFIILAGFLESFVTHNYQVLPDWSKWLLIMLSFGIIIFLYVIYPIYVARKYPHLVHQEEAATFIESRRFSFYKIRTVGENIADGFKLYRNRFGVFARVNTLVVLPLALTLIIWQDINHYELQQTQYWYDWSAQLEFMFGYCFINTQDYIVCALWTIVLALFLSSVFWSVSALNEKVFSWGSFFGFVRRRFIGIWVSNLILCFIVFVLPWQFLLLAVFVMPFLYLNAATAAFDQSGFGARLGKGFKFSKQHYGNSLLILLVLLFITALIMQPVALVFSIHEPWSDEPMIRDLLDFAADFIKRVAQVYTEDYMIWANLFRQLIYLAYIFALLPVVAFTMSLGYFSEVERSEVLGLKEAFRNFGKRSRFQEKEVDYE